MLSNWEFEKFEKFLVTIDELLKGSRHGQRSVRLSRSYRVIYTEDRTGIVNIIEVLEVNKHDY